MDDTDLASKRLFQRIQMLRGNPGNTDHTTMQDCDISIIKTCRLVQLLLMHLNEVNRVNLARQEYDAGRRQMILRSFKAWEDYREY